MPVNRATSMYVILLVLFGAGLWTIVTFGSILLKAPTDLSGQWDLRAGDADAPTHRLNVQQSGKFFSVRCDGQQNSLKLVSETTQPGGNKQRLVLKGNAIEITLDGVPNDDHYAVEIRSDGPMRGQWLATRVQRTYALRHTEGSAPQVAHADTGH